MRSSFHAPAFCVFIIWRIALAGLVRTADAFQRLTLTIPETYTRLAKSPTPQRPTLTWPLSSSTTQLGAKKRRRRKESPSTAQEEKEQLEKIWPEGADAIMDLPDFDLADDADGEGLLNGSSSSSSTASSSKSISSNPDEITPAMMGTAIQSVGTIDDLLADRSLEQKFQFEGEENAADIPDFVELAARSSTTTTPNGGNGEAGAMGKKKQRQAERRAMAIRAREAEEADSNGNPLTNLPFLKDEKGKVSGVKILESGGEYSN